MTLCSRFGVTNNPYLPVLVPAAIGFVVVSAIAALALAWTKAPDVRELIRRGWIALMVLMALGVLVFWIATAMVEGPRRSTIDKGLQDQQTKELHVTVVDIFERYGNQEARSYGRQVATSYDSDLDMNNSRPAIENALSRNLDQRLRDLHAPL